MRDHIDVSDASDARDARDVRNAREVSDVHGAVPIVMAVKHPMDAVDARKECQMRQ